MSLMLIMKNRRCEQIDRKETAMSTDKKEYGISVIIPCYNVGQYVEETLKSVLNQSFKNYEIICLNDGSTDGTLEILNKYQSLYPDVYKRQVVT